MAKVSNNAKVLYLVILIIFLLGTSVFWFDYIGLISLNKYIDKIKGKTTLVKNIKGDEPDLVAREEFNKQIAKLQERIEALDKRESSLQQREKKLQTDVEKLEQMKKGLQLEKKKFIASKSKHADFQKNIRVLAKKISNMPPGDSVKIMIRWEDPLIIAVLRQMDSDAQNAGTQSITSYLITLMPKEKASRIMYLMTQI